MNYGPLVQSIEQLIAVIATRPSRKDDKENAKYNANIARCWREIGIQQDNFYDEIVAGRILKGE